MQMKLKVTVLTVQFQTMLAQIGVLTFLVPTRNHLVAGNGAALKKAI
jgi:hypothetical protein